MGSSKKKLAEEFYKQQIQHSEDLITDLKKQLKQKRRQDVLFERLAVILKEQKPLINYVPLLKKHTTKGKTHEALALMLSDCHGDQEILSKRVMGYEDYNFEEFCRRTERLVNTIITFCFENMAMHIFDELHIFGLGDYVSGEIHGAREHSKWANSIKNSIGVGEVFSMMIFDLSKYFKKIYFYSVSGNHGRRSLKKDYRGAHDNWDYLVALHTSVRCQNLIDNGRLIVDIPDSFSHSVEIFNHKFFLNHGDEMRSYLGTPYYQLDKTTKNLQALAAVKKTHYDYFLYGHWHKMAGAQITTGDWLINGNFFATDEFILNKFGGYTEPKQKIFGIHPVYGKTWELGVNLRSEGKQDAQGRYKVTLFED